MARDAVGAHRHAGVPVSDRVWRDQEIRDDDVSGMLFQDCVFERVRILHTNFANAIFLNCQFDDCLFEECYFHQSVMTSCKGERLCLRAGTLSMLAIGQAELSRLEIEQSGNAVALAESKVGCLAFDGLGRAQQDLTVSGCELREVLADGVSWRGASVVQGELDKWSLDNAEFTRCSFIEASAQGVDLGAVRFDSCNLYKSKFAEGRLRAAERSIFAECDLAAADLAEAKLSGALFAKATAAEANFERADLSGAMFPDAQLAGANFAGASARNSVWLRADLTGADFTNVDAWRGSFRNAVFKDANVQSSSFVEADLHAVEESLAGADLREARGSVSWRAEREAESSEPSF